MGRVKWNNFSRGLWLTGPAEDNPEGTVRRAKGVYPLRTQAARSRSGTLQYFGINANSMTRFNDEYILGTAAGLYQSASLAIDSETAVTGGAVFDGTKLTFAQAPPTSVAVDETTNTVNDYLFIAGGGELRKLSPAWAVTEWGIAPPDVSSMTAVAVAEGDANRRVIDACDALTVGADTWTWERKNGPGADASLTATTTHFVEGIKSLRIATVLKNTEGYIERNFTGGLDLSTFADNSTVSSEEDFITFFVRTNRPNRIKSLEIAFAVGPTGVSDFDKNAYIFEMKVQKVKKRRKKALFGTGDIIRKKDEKRFIEDHESQKRDFSTAEFREEGVVGVARRRWTRVTIAKSSFKKSGNAGTTNLTWANVIAMRFSIETNKKGKANINFDGVKMIGGTGMQGDYQYNITYKNSTTGTRSNPDLSNTVDVEDINRTGVTLDAIPLSTDSQVDKIEIWRTLGNGTRLFKCKEIANTEWGVGEGDQKTTDNVADYIGMFKGAASKLDDEELPIDNLKPEDTYEDVAGPHVNRMWWSRDTAVDPDNSLPAKAGRLYYSPKGRFEAVDGFIDVSGNDDAIQKIVVWDERLWAFTTSHVYEIKHDDEPFLPVAVVGAPGTTKPFTVVSTSKGIVYRANDGVRIFPGDSGTSDLLGHGDPLAPIWRNSTTDGFAVTFTGDHAAYGRGEYYLTDGTDNTRTTLACDVTTGAWREVGFPCEFLYFDPEGNRLFGSPEPGVVTSVWTTRHHTATYAFTASTTNLYGVIGTTGLSIPVFDEIGKAQFRAPKAFILTGIYMKLGVAVDAGKSISCNLNVDGQKVTTDDNGATFTCTIDNDDGTDVVSATGSISVAADALVCWEFSFSNTTSALVKAVSASYTTEVE